MSRTAQQHSRELFWRSLVVVPILVLLFLQFLQFQSGAQRRVGFYSELMSRPIKIVEVDPDSPAGEHLVAGDVLSKINDWPIETDLDYDEMAQHFGPDKSVKFTILRDGEERDFMITPGMPVELLPFYLTAIIVASYVFIALLAVAKRPGSLPSRLLYFLAMILAADNAMPSSYYVMGAPLLLAATEVVASLLDGLQFGAEFHLVSLIPRRQPWLRRFSWLIKVYYGIGLAGGILASVTYVLEDYHRLEIFPWTYGDIWTFHDGPWLLWRATLMAAALLYSIWYYQGQRERVQSTLVLAGLTPWILYTYVTMILGRMEYDYLWIESYWTLCVLAFPASIFVMLRLDDLMRTRVLRNLIDEVQDAGSIDNIAHLISDKLNLAFYTKCNYVFFRASRDSELSSMHTSGSTHQVEHIPDDYKILEVAGQRGEVLAYPDDIRETLPAAEIEWLDCLGTNLIAPLIERDGYMAGLLILGQKRSEEPYTPDDLELLRSLAGQIALAHENIGLQTRIHEQQRVERQVLERLEGQKIAPVKECPSCGFCYDSGDEKCPRDGATLTLTLPVERLVDGRYRLEQVLGRGGAAVVYLASDVRLNRGVAIKILTLSLLDDKVAPRRFEHEARVAAQLLHPNIVTTHDFGKTHNGMPYIVMEHLEGRTLRQVLKRNDCFEGAAIAGWFDQVLDGLGAAHAHGVVHRDLKPDNVFVVPSQMPGEQDQIKLLDFGLAKILNRDQDESFTTPGTIMGTLAYMAPEQLQGQEIDRRSDLYSVGIMAYEAVTGGRPFEGHTPSQVLAAILKGGHALPESSGTQELRRVLDRCLQQEKEKRYTSVAQLQRVLIPALHACPRLGPIKSAA